MRAAFALVLLAIATTACSDASMHDRTELARIEGALQVEAQHVLTLAGGSCEPAPAALDGGTFGPFDEVCNVGFGTQPAVELRHFGAAVFGGGRRVTGLVYHPTTTRYRELVTCMKHIAGSWSAFARPDETSCPPGYELTGG